ATIAEKREAELRCAAEKLGLAGVHFLDYRDSGMPGSADNDHPRALVAAPLEEVAEKIVGFIRQLRPQVVLTFDPIGGYKHPDHIAIHDATVRAFQLAGDPALNGNLPPYQPQKLYYHVIPKKFMRIALRLMSLLGTDPRHYGRNQDIDLTALVDEGDFPIHAKINYHEVLAIKDDAASCHASQLTGPGLRRGPLRWAMRLMGDNDYFMRAYPPVEGRLHERDLFQKN
ncbi:MAG: PIG-L deacetylase family protein, partial [Anaerolineales bacterium]